MVYFSAAKLTIWKDVTFLWILMTIFILAKKDRSLYLAWHSTLGAGNDAKESLPGQHLLHPCPPCHFKEEFGWATQVSFQWKNAPVCQGLEDQERTTLFHSSPLSECSQSFSWLEPLKSSSSSASPPFHLLPFLDSLRGKTGLGRAGQRGWREGWGWESRPIQLIFATVKTSCIDRSFHCHPGRKLKTSLLQAVVSLLLRMGMIMPILQGCWGNSMVWWGHRAQHAVGIQEVVAVIVFSPDTSRTSATCIPSLLSLYLATTSIPHSQLHRQGRCSIAPIWLPLPVAPGEQVNSVFAGLDEPQRAN